MSQGAHKHAQIEASSKAYIFDPYFGVPPHQNVCGGRGVLKGGAKAPLDRGSNRPCTGILRLQHPRDVVWRLAQGCKLQFGTKLIMSWYRCRPAVPQVLRGGQKHQGSSAHSGHYLKKGEGFDEGIGWGLPMGGKGAKIEVSGCELVAEICTWILQGSRNWYFSKINLAGNH